MLRAVLPEPSTERLATRARVRQTASPAQSHEELVARAVADIREIVTRTVAAGLERVGDYLLDTFYGGDARRYYAGGAKKPASLRLLEARCETIDLPVSRTFLANAIRIAALSRALPEDSSFRKLPPSHRVELLRLPAPAKIEQVAATALAQRLTVRKLRELVASTAPRASDTRGRKPTPPLVRALRRANALLSGSGTELAFKREGVVALTGAQYTEANRLATTLLQKVDALRKLLR